MKKRRRGSARKFSTYRVLYCRRQENREINRDFINGFLLSSGRSGELVCVQPPTNAPYMVLLSTDRGSIVAVRGVADPCQDVLKKIKLGGQIPKFIMKGSPPWDEHEFTTQLVNCIPSAARTRLVRDAIKSINKPASSFESLLLESPISYLNYQTQLLRQLSKSSSVPYSPRIEIR